MVTMTEYREIVEKINYKTIKQEKYINSLNRNKTKAAWAQSRAPLTVQGIHYLINNYLLNVAALPCFV